jgi:phosphoglycolate phosphatase-like HAD superfamily hydrolase
MSLSPRPLLRGVVFDMDGTLTIPNLDFGEMYRRCGVEGNKDILYEIRNHMLPDQASKATAIIEEMEEEGRRTLQLQPGALELTQWLQAHQIPTALVTRNTKRSAQVLEDKLLLSSSQQQQQHYQFDVVISRDDNDHPPKPDPASMRYIASRWNLELPTDTILMVGDSPANDIVYGKSAGVKTALLDTGRRYLEHGEGKSDGAMGADMIVDHLYHLPSHLWRTFEIQGALGSTAQGLHGQPAPHPTLPLTIAAAKGDLTTMEKLLLEEQHNDIVNAPDECGNTALIWAAEMGHLKAVDRLLQVKDQIQDQASIHVNARGYLGATATCRAARRGHVQVLERLAQAGANLDIPNDKLQYPLHFAAFKQNQDAVQVLLQHGANTRVLDRKGT